MNRSHYLLRRGLIACFSVAVILLGVWPAWAQTFSSGSTGADGAFAPTANTTLTLPASGVFNFTTVTIPAGVTVDVQRNAGNTPVTILTTGDITVAGTLQVNGTNGGVPSTGGPVINVGGAGGPGGFPGGNGAARGGGLPASGGQGPAGGRLANNTNIGDSLGQYGFSSTFVSLIPLIGGSGGGGAVAPTGQSGASGGGGGGALLIASSTKITVTGALRANGGNGSGDAGACTFPGFERLSGPGSGGAIRLVAPEITGSGTIEAKSGLYLCSFGLEPFGVGRIRLEAFTQSFTGTFNPSPSLTSAPGPVTATSNPALVNLPALTISAVGGVAAPGTPGGSYTTADVALPQGTTNPVPVTLTAANIPVPATFTVKVIPSSGAPTTTSSGQSSGTFASSTATASVTFPSGQVSVLNAFGSFTLPTQLAGLFPAINGDPLERIMVAASYGGPSTLMLVTKSGKEFRPDQLPLADQVKLATAFETLSKVPRR